VSVDASTLVAPKAPAAAPRRVATKESGAGPDGAGAIMLATLGVAFDPSAVDFAVETAAESHRLLIVVNVLSLEPMPMSLMLGYSGVLEDPPELAAAIRAPAERAHALGLGVERVRIRTPHRIEALLEFVTERAASLLVFGPDPTRLRKRLYLKVCRAVRERAPCLVWIND
jgi:nucleotide-binding universal stress UspA family protein